MENRDWMLRRVLGGMRLALLAGVAIGVALAGSRVGFAQDAQLSGPDGGAAVQVQEGQAVAADPPDRVARIGVLMGDVSMEPASVDQFSAAEMNYPLTTGDRMYTDVGANAELQTGQLAVRLGQQTDLTVTAMTDTLAQFGLAQGAVHLRSFALDPGETVELDTPNVAVTVLQPGDVRVDVDPNGDTTTVELVSGQVEVDGNGLQQVLEPGQSVRLAGADPVSAQWLNAGTPDGLDNFSTDRDGLYESAVATESAEVNPNTIGAEDLESNGDWDTDPVYGAVWFPSGVAVGWVPYSCGRWAWVAPWGWTWVGCESWGFAPFHYGRWNRFGNRWGWIPGPPVLRPVYAPGLVVFAGGNGFAVGGVGATAWFPLGPGEAYVPWYHASGLYVNRVNVADLSTRNLPVARRIYNDRTDAFVVGPDGGVARNYVNRPLAMTAVPRTSFAAGRPVETVALRLDPEQRAAAQVLPHPLVTPERAIVAPVAAQAIPQRVARPTLASREGTKEPPALAVQGVETGARSAGANGVGGSGVKGVAPVERAAPGERPAPARAQGLAAQETEQPVNRPGVEGAPGVSPVQRPLYNRAVPPPPRPNFEQQRQAIESTDPGRPLSPRQMDNLRQNQPVGPPQQREMPHPAPAPRFEPPPRPAPAPKSAPPPKR